MGRVIHHQVDENRQQGAQQGPAFASANEASRDTVRKIRQHEAAAATRAAPLAALERREIAPRNGWRQPAPKLKRRYWLCLRVHAGRSTLAPNAAVMHFQRIALRSPVAANQGLHAI